MTSITGSDATTGRRKCSHCYLPIKMADKYSTQFILHQMNTITTQLSTTHVFHIWHWQLFRCTHSWRLAWAHHC